MPSVVLICTGNCCRSPMAEAIWRHIAGDTWDVYSAGSHPAGYVHEHTLALLERKDIDASGLKSKGLYNIPVDNFTLAVTLCSNAQRCFPVLPADEVLHWPLPDPYYAAGSDNDIEQAYEKVYSILVQHIEEYLQYI